MKVGSLSSTNFLVEEPISNLRSLVSPYPSGIIRGHIHSPTLTGTHFNSFRSHFFPIYFILFLYMAR